MKTITLTIDDHDSGKRVSRQFYFEHARQYRLGSEAYLAEEMKHAMHDLDVANEKNVGVASAIQALGGWLFAASAATNAVHVLRITSISAQTAMNQVKRAQLICNGKS